MAKYMIQIDESDNAIIGNNKQALLKAHKEAMKIVYEAYLNCCEVIEEVPTMTLADLMLYNEIELYDGYMIKLYNYEIIEI